MNTIVGNKKFLSDNTNEFGNIAWYVKAKTSTVIESTKEVKVSWIESEIRISDCAKSVTLSMGLGVSNPACSDADAKQNLDERLDKINNLISQLEEFKKAYSEAIQCLKS